jgi:hypothetical protein
MLLKKLIPLLALTLLNISPLKAGSFMDGNDLHSQEIVIQYSGAKGYLRILEYNIRSLKKSKADIKTQSLQMMEDAKNSNFCKKRFALDDFTSLQEIFRVNDRQLDSEYHLMTKSDDVLGLLKSIVCEILGEQVEIEVTPALIIMKYEGKKFHAIPGSNAMGPMEKNGKMNLFWRPGTQSFQMVFDTDEKGKPIRKLFPEKVGSPELTPEEIMNWRNQ